MTITERRLRRAVRLLAREERNQRRRHARRLRAETAAGEFGDKGTPRCECCGAFIYRAGLCGQCAEIYPQPLPVQFWAATSDLNPVTVQIGGVE